MKIIILCVSLVFITCAVVYSVDSYGVKRLTRSEKNLIETVDETVKKINSHTSTLSGKVDSLEKKIDSLEKKIDELKALMIEKNTFPKITNEFVNKT